MFKKRGIPVVIYEWTDKGLAMQVREEPKAPSDAARTLRSIWKRYHSLTADLVLLVIAGFAMGYWVSVI